MSKYQLLQLVNHHISHNSTMPNAIELPNCVYPTPTTLITPCSPTPKHSLFLSNLDDQTYLRMFIDYVYLFKKSVSLDVLKSSLSRVLVDYYPLAGRLRTSIEDDTKLEVEYCNGEGALFVEASMDITVDELLKYSMMPNMSWSKFKYSQLESKSFLDSPTLVIQVTNLPCGGMILYATISHCLCDGIGASLFLNAWAELTKTPNTNLTIIPFHDRHMLKSRDPPQVMFPHPLYNRSPPNPETNLHMWTLSQLLVPTSFTFGPTEVHQLKKQCMSSLEYITDFEVIASHTWRSYIRSLNLSPNRIVKLAFTLNFREKVSLPKGYYGNGFILACVETTVKDLVAPNNLSYCVKLVKQTKASVDGEYIRSTIDLLKEKTLMAHDDISLSISKWSRLGLEDIDFGEGKPLYMGPMRSEFYCLFLPVIGEANATRVLLSVPNVMLESFQHHMMMIES